MAHPLRAPWQALDARVGAVSALRRLGRFVMPGHWTFLLGVATLACGLLLTLTGVFLMIFYVPSTATTTYTGSSPLYGGRELPAAFESIVRLSHDVPGGLLLRRVHAVSAHLFVALAALHLLRVVLTGAFRRPREINYHVGWALLVLGIAAGYTGHLLTYETLAGTSMRILYTFLAGIPWVGEDVASWAFGGEFPTGAIIGRLHMLHTVVLPALLAGGIATHLALVVRQSHTQLPVPGIDGDRVVGGRRLWPARAAEHTTAAVAVAGLVVLSSAVVPWADVDLAGPYGTALASNASHPTWYLFWVFGGQRLYPGFHFSVLGATITGPFVMGVVLPTLFIVLLLAYPWIERRATGDEGRDHHVTQGPLDVPFRAGVVAGILALLGMLSVAGATDQIARGFGLSIEGLVVGLRVATVLVPPLVGLGVAVYARARRREAR